MNELYKANIKGNLYRLVFELNKDTRITVRTPVGESGKRETGEGLTQGSIGSAIISSLNLSKGVDDFFQTSESELSYGTVSNNPKSF